MDSVLTSSASEPQLLRGPDSQSLAALQPHLSTPLHLLNVLHYDKSNIKNLKLNQQLLGQYLHQPMFSLIEDAAHTSLDQVFLENYQRSSIHLSTLIDSFVARILGYLNSNATAGDCYLAFRSILLVGIRYPSVLEQIYNHRIITSKLSKEYLLVPSSWKTRGPDQDEIGFLQFMVDCVEVSQQLTLQFLLLVARTNSGFTITPRGLIVTSNLSTLVQLIHLLSRSIQYWLGVDDTEQRLVNLVGCLMCLEAIVSESRKGLLGLYILSSPQEESTTRYEKQIINDTFNSIYLQVLPQLGPNSQPLLVDAIMSLLVELCAYTTHCYQIGEEGSDNLKYHLNNHLLQKINGETVEDWMSLPYRSSEWESRLSCRQNKDFPSLVSFVRCQQEGVCGWSQYSILKEEEVSRLVQQSQQHWLMVSRVTKGDYSQRVMGFSLELNNLRHRFLSPVCPPKQSSPTEIQYQHPSSEVIDNTTQQTTQGGALETTPLMQSPPVFDDYMMMPDCFNEDGFIDEIEENKEISSFGELIGNSLDHVDKELITRVTKLDIMGDLERGRDVNCKLQFLSNEELLRLTAISSGRLLMQVNYEKEFRGFATSNNKGDMYVSQAPMRYLDEVYPGCRKVPFVQMLVSGRWSLIPSVPEEGLLRILFSFMESRCCQESQRKLDAIGDMCLHPTNLMFFTHSVFLMLSLQEHQMDLVQSQLKWSNIETVRSCGLQLLHYLFSAKLALPLWLLGEINTTTLQLSKIAPPLCFSGLGQGTSRGERNLRLVEMLLSLDVEKYGRSLYSVLALFDSYLDQKEAQSTAHYPWFDVEERDLILVDSFQQLISGAVTKRGVFHRDQPLYLMLKVVLKLYPSCYELLMMHLLQQMSTQVDSFVDQHLILTQRFTNRNPTIGNTQDEESMGRLVNQFQDLCGENTGSEQLLQQLSQSIGSTFENVFLHLVPWFKEWRFRVENRDELAKYQHQLNTIRERMGSARILKDHSALLDLEQEYNAAEYNLRDWRADFKNTLLKTFLQPIHECSSATLITSFHKAIDLLEATALVFQPTEDNLKITQPIYRRQSPIWRAILAFASVEMEESVNNYHTMSRLSTRDHLKDKEQEPRMLGAPRKSIRLSLINSLSNGLSSVMVLKRLRKRISLVGEYLEEGSTLMKCLSNTGSLGMKLRSIKRNRSGVVKEIEVNRNTIWFDTIVNIDQQFIDRDIRIKFREEIGIDYGGLTKEWLTSITQELFNPNFGLFELSANGLSIQPSRYSYLVPQHLMHFRKLGVLVGKALIEGWTLEINFTKSFLKHLLGNKIYVEDLFDIDPDTAKSLLWILDNHIGKDLEVYYCTQEEHLGSTKIVPLTVEGEGLLVTEDNKKEYVKAVCVYKMTSVIRAQAKALMEGLEEVVPFDILKSMDYKDLGLYLSGMPKIDVKQMREHAKYSECTSEDPHILWLWETLASFDDQLLANFLFFVTGSFKVAYGGFKEHPVTIHRNISVELLPVAHTCFNTLDLPGYPSRQILESKLRLSIAEGRGFGIS